MCSKQHTVAKYAHILCGPNLEVKLATRQRTILSIGHNGGEVDHAAGGILEVPMDVLAGFILA